MARSPVTRVQLDAYQFGQRRLESALARRDPIPLHEEVRGQRRIVLAGVLLAMLGLVGSYAIAKLMPKPAWQAQQVVVGKQSGRMFAVIHHPDRLVPVANLAAARLVRSAVEPGASAATATPVPVDDADLARAPRTASLEVPGADAVLPTADTARQASAAMPWALCDTRGGSSTMLIAGPAPVAPLAAEDGLYLSAPNGHRYLVVGGRKHRIEGRAALSAYDLIDQRPRPATSALLDAIPDGRVLAARIPAGAGATSRVLPGRQVGDVVRVVRPDQPERFYLVLAHGVQDIAEPVANLIRASLGVNPRQPPDSVRAELVNALPRATLPELADYPKVIPRIVSGQLDAVCWQWAPGGHTGTVAGAPGSPLPPGRVATRLAQADGSGPRLDDVALPTGSALVACAVRRDAPPTACDRREQTGESAEEPLWLVSETGVGYAIADRETATALGIQSWTPAPVDALRALPMGPVLDLAQARRAVNELAMPPSGG